MTLPRILFVDHTAALGGAELYLLDLARHFRDRSKVLLFEDGPFYERLADAQIDTTILEAGPSVLSVKKASGLLRSIRVLPDMLRLARGIAALSRDVDIVFANSQKALVACCLSKLFSGTPLVWNLHDMLTSSHFSFFNRQVAVRLANRFVDHLIANSRATVDAFENSGGKLPTTIVYNGIDASRFRTTTSERDVESLRESIGLGTTPIIGVFSRLTPWKGQHVLLDALVDLRNTQVLFVGDALFEGDVSYKEQLLAKVRDRNLSDRVHFVGFREDIPKLMNLVDVVAHTSTAPEPFGRVIVEAMLSRRPVIATRAGGAVEIIEHGTTGLLVPPGDSSELRHAISFLLSNPLKAEEMVENAHESALKRFSVRQMTKGVEKAVLSL